MEVGDRGISETRTAQYEASARKARWMVRLAGLLALGFLIAASRVVYFEIGERTRGRALEDKSLPEERKRAQGRLHEYEKAVEGFDEMILVIDREYRYVIANRAYLNYRGLT